MKRPDKPVLIKLTNAIAYPSDPDTDYRVSDTTKHLKLRVLRSGTRHWEYDYIWKGKRQKYSWPLEGCTPPQARAKVAEWETNRKVKKLDPFTKAAKGISLVAFKDEYFEHRKIKPATNSKGVKSGLSEKEYYERKRRFDKHFADYAIAQTPLLKLQLSEIETWFDNIAKDKPSEALACLFLGSHMTKYALKSSEELRGAIANKFDAAVDKDDVSAIKESIEESRTKRPMTQKEWNALWDTCESYGDELGGLMVQFIMSLSTRGKHAIELSKTDIEFDEEEGVYHFTAKFKKKWDTVVLTDRAKKIYEKILALHKKEGWITDYLFPSRDFRGGGKFQGLRNRPMNSNDKQLIFTGRDRRGGIRAAAAKIAPSILGIKSKTKADLERYGEFKLKPLGLHDVRDTYATNAGNISTATQMLQNSQDAVTKKHYAEESLKDKIKIAKEKDKLLKVMFKNG